MRHGNRGQFTHFEVIYSGVGGMQTLMSDKGTSGIRRFMKRETARKVIEARNLLKGTVVPIRKLA